MKILEAFGTFAVDPAYDYKAERGRNGGLNRVSRRRSGGSRA